MRKILTIMSVIVVVSSILIKGSISVSADEKKEYIDSQLYELGEKDDYDLSKAQKVTDSMRRFYVEGNISDVSKKNGFTSYAVESGNLKLFVDTSAGIELNDLTDNTKWHIVKDSSNIVDSTKLEDDIKTGAIIVQTSKDGKIWINADTETDIYNKTDSINDRKQCGEAIKAFYETSSVQLTNGCYYRIIVAYKLEREIDPSKILFVNKKNYEEKERVELYQFYAYDPSVNSSETLDVKDAYEFSTVYRADSVDGFDNPVKIKSDDPHIDWKIGRFYVSGYTDYRKEDNIPVFLKTPDDRAVLWFSLEQELDKCNGKNDIKVNYTEAGSDISFDTPQISNLGRGMLIIRKTDKYNKQERQIYTNYLEASATVGANTKVELFEEGDYEVALDYQLHYDKPFVFGTKSTKTLPYRISFNFKVRNGDIRFFLRDSETDEFIRNANVAEKGFYIDVANSQYLNIFIKKEVLSDSMDGLIEDPNFTQVAKDGSEFKDEGIYTVTVKNPATGESIEKRIYVGNRDIILAYMKNGISISEINERIENGATIDEYGNIIDKETEIETNEAEPDTEGEHDIEDNNEEISDQSIENEESNVDTEGLENKDDKQETSNNTESMNEIINADGQSDNYAKISSLKYVMFSLAVVLAIGVCVVFKKKGSHKDKR